MEPQKQVKHVPEWLSRIETTDSLLHALMCNDSPMYPMFRVFLGPAFDHEQNRFMIGVRGIYAEYDSPLWYNMSLCEALDHTTIVPGDLILAKAGVPKLAYKLYCLHDGEIRKGPKSVGTQFPEISTLPELLTTQNPPFIDSLQAMQDELALVMDGLPDNFE